MEAVIEDKGMDRGGILRGVFGSGPMGRGEYIRRVLIAIAVILGGAFLVNLPEMMGLMGSASGLAVSQALSFAFASGLFIAIVANYFWAFWRARDVAKSRSGAVALFLACAIVPLLGLILYVAPGRQ